MQPILSAVLVALVISTLSGMMSPVEARINLNGTYAFTQTQSCTVTFGPDFGIDGSGAQTVITGGVFRTNQSNQGTTTMNPDGTGMSKGRSVTMNISATAIGASIVSISEFSVPFTYTIENDNQVVANFGEGTFTVLLGAGTGNTGTSSPFTGRAQIGNGGQVIVSGPAVEIHEDTLVFNGGAFTQHRLCTRSTTDVRIGEAGSN